MTYPTGLHAISNRQLALDRNPIDIIVECGQGSWSLSRAALASRSDYFAIACSIEQQNPQKRGKFVIPEKRQRHIACLFHFLQTNKYTGPLDGTRLSAVIPDHDPNLKSGQCGGFTLWIQSDDQQIQRYFPEMKDGWTMHGDRALKACTIMTMHEFSKSQTALETVRPHWFRLKPEALPRPMQFELFEFLAELKFNQLMYSSNAVFHAKMFWRAQKYLIPDLEDAVAQAFRMGVKPYTNTASPLEGAFTTAIRVIWEPRELLYDNNKILHVLVRVIAANWGWMRHDPDMMKLLQRDGYTRLLDMVRYEAARNLRKWDMDHLPIQTTVA